MSLFFCANHPKFYSEMFELKGGDGQPLFNQLRIGLSCEACKAAGQAHSCTHKKDIIPPWKSAAKFDMVKAIVSMNLQYIHSILLTIM